tara:strand:- start:693 stop:962 length:270 start_codon:yes stop_codon:yes gene_type:complete
MSRFGDLLRGGPPAPKVEAAPVPEPVVEERPDLGSDETQYEEEIAETDVSLENMTKKELEEYGRTLGIELDRRHSKASLIEELKAAESE